MTARTDRGRQSELRFAEWLRPNGWPYAEAVGKGAGGADITGVPGISLEVKARKDFNPGGWLKQAEQRPGLPLVVMRLNGQGVTDIGRWFAGMRLDDAVRLLRAAGYGDPDGR